MDKAAMNQRRNQWYQIVLDCTNRDPGMSKKAWCAENGINFRSFMYWQRSFRNDVTSVMLPAAGKTAVSTALSNPPVQAVPAFADITEKFQESAAEPDYSVQARPAEFIPEVMIRSGACEIYVGGNVSTRTLKAVMKVLAHA